MVTNLEIFRFLFRLCRSPRSRKTPKVIFWVKEASTFCAFSTYSESILKKIYEISALQKPFESDSDHSLKEFTESGGQEDRKIRGFAIFRNWNNEPLFQDDGSLIIRIGLEAKGFLRSPNEEVFEAYCSVFHQVLGRSFHISGGLHDSQ